VPQPTNNSVIELPQHKDNGLTTILVIDDNADMRAYLRYIFTDKPYQIIEADNGRNGIMVAQNHLPDLVITDLMMPEVDGYELAEILKNNTLTSHIPIIMLTARGNVESRVEGLRRGTDVYLQKPFHTEELIWQVERLLLLRFAWQQRWSNPLIESSLATAIIDGIKVLDIDEQWLTELRMLIKTQLITNNLVIDDLPRHFSMNRTQFYKKVKALTNETPAILVRNVRLDYAYELLNSPEPPTKINKLAEAVGMNDPNYFKVLFEERFNVSLKTLMK
jgi:DNA-binding response OmpR family regulator